MRTLKLLLTDKYYRWARIERLRLKFVSLPIIENIAAWYYTYKMHRKIQSMSQWKRCAGLRNVEENSKEFEFTTALIRLQVCIMANGKNRKLFEQAKFEVLCNEMINEAKYKDFRKWLEEIDSSESDYSKVQELVNSFISK